MTTRTLIAAAIAFALTGCGEPVADGAAVESAAQRAHSAADALFDQLSGELAAALADGGTNAAIAVCKERAPAIAEDVSAATGVSIRRTALRVRNPDNAPDAWEREMMETFIARHAAGEDWRGMRAVARDGANVRWTRPIPMGGMCASCHGADAELAPETRAALAAAYPDDQATGFAEGELRGAFTARVPLHR